MSIEYKVCRLAVYAASYGAGRKKMKVLMRSYRIPARRKAEIVRDCLPISRKEATFETRNKCMLRLMANYGITRVSP